MSLGVWATFQLFPIHSFNTSSFHTKLKANPAKIADYYKDNPKNAEELATKAGIPEDKLRSFIKYSEIKKQI